ncbi:hypothetical protein E8A74_29930 [Polyangium fumosum]|uniref:Uncharacterized protein n=1 Tax=Polyangium fumosum TaxID=889272 RepID=A0A4U1J440_9BACT|nr:hypothetical protein E8A74_29930 [Polyangium fumosum]
MPTSLFTSACACASPGLVSPGFVSPGVSPGLVSPGFVSPGLVSPGFVSPGLSSPGLASPGLVSPSLVFAGSVVLVCSARCRASFSSSCFRTCADSARSGGSDATYCLYALMACSRLPASACARAMLKRTFGCGRISCARSSSLMPSG